MHSKTKLIQKYKEYIEQNLNTFDKKNGIRILSYNVQLFRDIGIGTMFKHVFKGLMLIKYFKTLILYRPSIALI